METMKPNFKKLLIQLTVIPLSNAHCTKYLSSLIIGAKNMRLTL